MGRFGWGTVVCLISLPVEATVLDFATSSSYSLRLHGATGGDNLGYGQAIGDFNHDSMPDLVVSAPTANGGGGYVYILYGPLAAGERDLATSSQYNVRFEGVPGSPGAGAGDQLAAGDLNGDGTDDLIISAPYAANSCANQKYAQGAVYVIFGGPSSFPAGTGQTRNLNLPSSYHVRFDGEACGDLPSFQASDNGDQLGFWLALGDLSGDGQPDLVMTSRYANHNGRTDSGSVYVRYGGAGVWPPPPSLIDLGTTSSFNIRYDGPLPAYQLGWSARVGLANGGSQPDLAVGSPMATTNINRMRNGSVHLFYGPLASGTGNIYDLAVAGNFSVRYEGASAGNFLGMNVALGEVTGDSSSDLVIGAPVVNSQGRTGNGAVYIAQGPTPAGPGTTRDLANGFDYRFDGPDFLAGPNAMSGLFGRLLNIAPLHGGNPELLISTLLADTQGRTDNGAVYSLQGPFSIGGGNQVRDIAQTNFSSSTVDYRYDGASGAGNGDQMGRSVVVGELNGMGGLDIATGSYLADTMGRTDNGALYIVFGTSSPPDAAVASDLAPPPDSAMSADLSMPDLAMPDLATPADMAIVVIPPPDMAMSLVDLVQSQPDLSLPVPVIPDLTMPVDLSLPVPVIPDLTMPVDLSGMDAAMVAADGALPKDQSAPATMDSGSGPIAAGCACVLTPSHRQRFPGVELALGCGIMALRLTRKNRRGRLTKTDAHRR